MTKIVLLPLMVLAVEVLSTLLLNIAAQDAIARENDYQFRTYLKEQLRDFNIKMIVLMFLTAIAVPVTYLMSH